MNKDNQIYCPQKVEYNDRAKFYITNRSVYSDTNMNDNIHKSEAQDDHTNIDKYRVAATFSEAPNNRIKKE